MAGGEAFSARAFLGPRELSNSCLRITEKGLKRHCRRTGRYRDPLVRSSLDTVCPAGIAGRTTAPTWLRVRFVVVVSASRQI